MTLFQKLVFKLKWNECEILKRHLAMLAAIEVFDQNRKSVQRNHVEIAALSDQSHTLHRLWIFGLPDVSTPLSSMKRRKNFKAQYIT